MQKRQKFYLICPLLLDIFYTIWITSRTYHYGYAFIPAIDDIVQIAVIVFIFVLTLFSFACDNKASKLFRVSAAVLLPLSIVFLFFDASHYVQSLGTILLQIITCTEALLSGIFVFAARGGNRQKALTRAFVIVVAAVSALILIGYRVSFSDEAGIQTGSNTSPGGAFTYSIRETSHGTKDAIINIQKAGAHLNIFSGRLESISYDISTYDAGMSLSWKDDHTLLINGAPYNVDVYK